MRILLMFLLACEQQSFPAAEVRGAGDVEDVHADEMRTLAYALDDYAASRRPHDGGLPAPRRDRAPTAANEDTSLCTAGEARWRRVPCESHGFPPSYDDECYYSVSEDRLIRPTCVVDTCGEPFYSEAAGTMVQPFGVRFRDCPAEMAGGDLDDVGVRRR